MQKISRELAADNSWVVTPFLPPLSHLATIQVAIPLFYEFDRATLDAVFTEIQLGSRDTSGEGSQDDSDVNYRRAKDSLLFIPESLREEVLMAVRGLHCAVKYWRLDHLDVLRFTDGECSFHWRCDGSIDTIKTVEQLVLDRDICIMSRFEIACKYSLLERIVDLWFEMLLCGRTKSLARAMEENWMVRFWVRWLRGGCEVPWNQAAAEYLRLPDKVSCLTLNGRVSSFFPFLQPEDRRTFLLSVAFCRSDDFRFCLYAMTEAEEEQLLEKNYLTVLLLYLKWPLQSLFLKTVHKLWDFIDARSFDILLYTIYFYIKDGRGDFDYCQLFSDFWNRSPPRLTKSARKCPDLCDRIDICLNGIKMKRKADADERKNLKKKFKC